MPAHPLLPARLDYQTPAPVFLDPHPPRYGLASFVYGVCSAISALLFVALRSSSPFSIAMLLTFPLAAAIPIFGLSGVVRGLDAVALRRQPTLAFPGLILSLLSMALLARALFARF